MSRTPDAAQWDLVVLVADKNMEFTLRGLLARHEALRIRKIEWEVFVHPHRDPGCLTAGHEFLRQFLRSHAHALVIFDRHGCGREEDNRESIDDKVEKNLRRSGWSSRAAGG